VRGRFDLIVSNPPYIPSGDLAGLAPEVREHDPLAALHGGEDGLAAYRIVFAGAPDLLAPGGALVVEIGSTQDQAVTRLAEAARLRVVRVARDLAGRPRAVALAADRPVKADLAVRAGTPI
jgi:release factor glutamine methyltransferase